MQGPNVFAKEHAEVQRRTLMDRAQNMASLGLEHLVVQPASRFLAAAGAVLHLS